MRFLYLFLLVLLLINQAFGQKQKRHNTYFYKNDGTRVSVIDSADYYRVVSEPDSGSKLYNVEEYDKNNRRTFIGRSSLVVPVRLQGQAIYFYPNGQKKLSAEYYEGYLSGNAYAFYPNGKLYMYKQYIFDKKKFGSTTEILDSLILAVYDSTGKALAENGNGAYRRYSNDFKEVQEQGTLKNGRFDGALHGSALGHHVTFDETYANGKLVSGESVDSAGKKFIYTARMVASQFPGGKDGLTAYMTNNLTYPMRARANNTQGIVQVKFVIGKDGVIRNARVINPVSPELDKEALRIVKEMPKWSPTYVYGMPVSSYYILPVAFVLKDQSYLRP